MTEDSGAFKTNPGDSCQIPAIYNAPARRRSKASGPNKPFPACERALRAADIFNKRREAVAVFSNKADSRVLPVVRCIATAAGFVVTAFPIASKAFVNPAKAELASRCSPASVFCSPRSP
jgi:hypothetical protein